MSARSTVVLFMGRASVPANVGGPSTFRSGTAAVARAARERSVRYSVAPVFNWILLGAAGFAAGVVNAIAGGGTLISFPALLHTGVGALTANATNTAAVTPGSASSVLAYRKYLAQERHRVAVLIWPSLLGGLCGAWLLLHTPERAFNAVVPWLILFACALLAIQTPVARWVARRTRSTA